MVIQQTYPVASPNSPYYGLESSQADYSNDSAPSPDSPLSLVFTNPYQLPSPDDDWLAWDGRVLSPELEIAPEFEPEAVAAQRRLSISPAINPLDLSKAMTDDLEVSFGRGGLADTQPLFQALPQSALPTRQDGAVEPWSRPQPTMPGQEANPTSPTRSRKRKSSSSDDSSRSSGSPPPPSPSRRASMPAPAAGAFGPQKKTTHNVIEKRYRNNLNDKIAALRDSVPSLRIMARRLEHAAQSSDDAADGADDDRENEDLSGLTPAHKLNKATILSKATEYISHLERRNKNLSRENAALRDRVEGFEMMVMSRGRPGSTWT